MTIQILGARRFVATTLHRTRAITTAALCVLAGSSFLTTSSTQPSSFFYYTSAMALQKDPRFRTWPITATKSLEPTLKEMGLELDAEAIDGTTTTSSDSSRSALSDALVSVGTAGRGGTGSFVSPQGLIVTNWHVAYDAVRRASIDAAGDGDVDYVRDGFVARSLENEIEGPNYECWITEACTDVSDKVLETSLSIKDPLERANTIRNIRQAIAQEAQSDAVQKESIRCDVVEMVPNKSYVLFTYKRLRDVRIVYVPPKSLGGFGGDADNFEWPRHTADFTLLRAYVPPSPSVGSSEGYHPDNVPYDSSNAFIRVRNPSEDTNIRQHDMVFLLGFPGSTMRYAPTMRLRYADEVAVPHSIRDFSQKLDWIAHYEQDGPTAALKLGSTKKGLANELKRSRGKLVMMRKLGLLEERATEETALVARHTQVQEILDQLSSIYDRFRADHSLSSALQSLRGIYGGSALMATGHHIHEYLAVEKNNPDGERETSYRKRNLPFLVQRLNKRLRDIHPPHEAELVQECAKVFAEVSSSLQDSDEVLAESARTVRETTILVDSDTAKTAVLLSSSKLLSLCSEQENDDENGGILEGIFSEEVSNAEAWLEDPFVKVAAALYPLYKRDKDSSKSLMSERDALFAKLLEFQQSSNEDDDGEESYPDCNGSLRISAGTVEGYTAADAVEHTPFTTLSGLLDKATEAKLTGTGTSNNEFECPDRLYQMLQENANGIQTVPVCLLYSTDTVGGNSGSPVMNQRGELVAINFDRQRQGLMNEYKWSSQYSRSIGVDVRYILWLIGEYDGAQHLVEELIATD